MAIKYARAGALLEADLADEIVALDEKRGLCFGLSSVASDVWRLLDQPRTLDQLVDTLLVNYVVDEPTCRREVDRLLSAMIAEGVVVSS